MENFITTYLRRCAIRRMARRAAGELVQAGYTPRDLCRLSRMGLELGIAPQRGCPPLADVLAAWPRSRP